MSNRHEFAGPLPGIQFVVDQRGPDDGPPVVWLHGALGDYDGVPFDVPQARLLTLHHLGFGVASGVEHFDRIGDLAVAYWWALDHLGLESVVLAGHSFGGAVAAEMAILQPQRVRGLALFAPFGLFDADDPGIDLFGTMPRDLMPALYADPAGPVATRQNPPAADAHERGLQTIARVQVLGAAGRFLFPIPDTAIGPRAYRLADIPTRVLLGAADGLVPKSLAAAWRETLPHAEVDVVEGAAHMLPYEQPAAAAAAVEALCADSLSVS